GQTCGNGVVEGTEECDDSNRLPMDGCSPSCLYEEELCSVLYPGSEDDDTTANCDDPDCATAKHCDPGEMDGDGDGFTPNMGDCADADATIHPAALEICDDGIDNNCDGDTDHGGDIDGDGAFHCMSGVVYDCNDYSSEQSPLNFEVPGDGIDNDCDTTVDEDPHSCDCTTGIDQAQAMGMCSADSVVEYYNGNSHGIATAYGNVVPQHGCRFFTISSGYAWDTSDFNSTNMGENGNPVSTTNCFECTTADTQSTWAHPGPEGCCEDDNDNDPSRLSIMVDVPANARSFSFQFIFFSEEYPYYVGSTFNDTLYVVMDSMSLSQIQNITFAASENPADTLQPVTINNSLFENPLVTDIGGTGYDVGGEGGTTGWVTTTAPCIPGETIIIDFWIHDEGDHVYDSAAVIDNFQWHVESVDGPVTVK
nr:MopE-related protein [Deltaproteobacteria bacterium]